MDEFSDIHKSCVPRVSWKIHFFHLYLSFFPRNLGAVSDDQGGRFQENIRKIEIRNKGIWNPDMMGYYC